MENKELKNEIKKLEKEIVTFLKDIIALRSYSTEEGKVVERIRQEMEKLKFDEVFVDKIGNIVGRIGSGKTKILYDSHIDTVEVSEADQKEFNLLNPMVKNNIVFGRGASDNKAAITTMVYGGYLMKKFYDLKDITLYVVGTVQEEDCDGLAMEYLLKNSIPKPNFVVLGECTNLDIYRGHRGRVEIKVETGGKSSHASAPERGVNAIYKMAPIVSEIEKLNERLKQDAFLGKGTIVVSKIECDTNSLNSVPSKCTAYLDRRLTAGETVETSLKELRELPSAKNGEFSVLKYNSKSFTGLMLETDKYFPTWVLEEEHELVKAGVEAAKVVRNGEMPQISKWVFSTNGIASMGKMGIPTIGFGPSEERFAHSKEDQVTIDHLLKATEFYSILPTYFK